MSRASGGTTCPLCGKYSSLTVRRTLYRHAGSVSFLTRPGFMTCRASGFSPETATVMRKNKDAGRHAYRNEDGSWIPGGDE